MILKTTLGRIDEFIYKYEELLGWAAGDEVEESEDVHLGITNYRIQIPSLNISLREGALMPKNGSESYEYFYDGEDFTTEVFSNEDSQENEDEWEIEASCTVICELNEKDFKKYLGWTTSGFRGLFMNSFILNMTSRS